MAKAGGCLCGSVRYKAKGEDAGNFLCHCKNCQKQSGSAFSVNLVYPETQFEPEGSVSVYTDTSRAGNPVLRHFCANCGSPIFSTIPHFPGIIVLKVGTLDDNSFYDPAAEVWCDSRQNWVSFEKDYPEFATNPPL